MLRFKPSYKQQKLSVYTCYKTGLTSDVFRKVCKYIISNKNTGYYSTKTIYVTLWILVTMICDVIF